MRLKPPMSLSWPIHNLSMALKACKLVDWAWNGPSQSDMVLEKDGLIKSVEMVIKECLPI